MSLNLVRGFCIFDGVAVGFISIITPVRRYVCIHAVLVVQTKHRTVMLVDNRLDRDHALKQLKVFGLHGGFSGAAFCGFEQPLR